MMCQSGTLHCSNSLFLPNISCVPLYPCLPFSIQRLEAEGTAMEVSRCTLSINLPPEVTASTGLLDGPALQEVLYKEVTIKLRAESGQGEVKTWWGKWNAHLSDLHGLGHPAHCWSVWVYQNWQPASSRCLQRPVNQDECKPLGAQGNRHCPLPSTWSCDTRTW